MSTQLQIPDEMSQRFDELARYTGQPCEQVMLEVLATYLMRIGEEDARINAARAQIALRDVVEADEIRAEDATLLARLGVTPEQLTVIDTEIAREFEAYL
jgi:predicted transcriptional regulator